MFAYFFYIWYFEYGLILYEKIPNNFLFYTLCIIFLLLFNFFIRKVKVTIKIIFNIIYIILVLSLLVYPYIKGEKIYNDIECGKQIINNIYEYKTRNNRLPQSLTDIDNSECSKKIRYEYEIVNMNDYNSNLKKYDNTSYTLKEDSFYLRIWIEEYKPLKLLYSDRRKIFLMED